MESLPYLLFSLNSALYAVEALLVQEIFFLPELTPVAEAPIDIVGVINLRGEILPVMDINIRFHHQASEYNLKDIVIVLKWQEIHLGIIVNQVHQVENIANTDITSKLSYGREVSTEHKANFVAGIAKVQTDLVTLLNYENLFRHVDTQNLSYTKGLSDGSLEDNLDIELEGKKAESLLKKQRLFCPHATPEEKIIFRERAENLIRLDENQDFSGLIPLAVIGLDGEYFGLELDTVREFTDIRKITPVPCCPGHIIGNMNLRGEILTLIDIRGILNLEMNLGNTASKAMVIHVDDLVVGVTIDQVFDVMYLNPVDILSVPTAVHSINEQYLRGTAMYRDKLMGILELPKILRQESLKVEEEV